MTVWPAAFLGFLARARAATPPSDWPTFRAQLTALLARDSFGGDVRAAVVVVANAEAFLDAQKPGPEGLQ